MDDYRLLRLLEGKPIKDTRKRPSSHARGYKGGPSKTQWERRNVVGWDGEGANVPCYDCDLDWTSPWWEREYPPHTCEGKHIYNLLANSFGKYIINHEGLTTQQVLNFFLQESRPKVINVIYGGSYDVNMLLRDLPEDKIKQLWTNGTCRWNQYGISYAHRKRFSVKLYDYEGGSRKPIRSFTLWDVLGFFQKSFVVACRTWFARTEQGFEITKALSILDKIEEMKALRSSFSVEKIDEIVSYNHAECKLLVLLVQQLFAAMDEAGIHLTRYDGAGSIAAALLRKNNILEHGGNQDETCRKAPVSYQWAQYAYSGGRIEAPKIGNLDDGYIVRDDINSAYPSACLDLPSLTGATWTMADSWDGNSYSMAEIEWHIKDEMPFYPLWFRYPDGTIIYPRSGRGRYWGYEAQLMRDYFVEGRDYDIISACNCELAIDAKPFTFLKHDYATRLRFAQAGSMAAVALKLGMNSVYGKLAQQAGYRNGRIPTYHNLYWAGQITSSTRSRLYRAARQDPSSIIAFATDAIIGTKRLDLIRNDQLGGWTNEELDGVTIVQAGVYWLKQGEEWLTKYRGFDQGSLVREEILSCWATAENYKARLTRFYGMGSAVGLNNFTDYWRVWRTENRELDLTPKGKRIPGTNTNYHEQLCDTLPAINYMDETLSTPYPILWGLLGGVNLRIMAENGEDIRTAEEEYLDSYA